MEHIEEIIHLDNNVRSIGGIELVNTLVIRKPKDIPLAIVSTDDTITLIHAETVHLHWIQFEGTPESIEQTIKDRWDALEDSLKGLTGFHESQGILFKDASNSSRLCQVAYPKVSEATG